MLNQTVIVGRLVEDPKKKTLESGKEVGNITLAVSRSYKNADGVYDTDFIDCTLWNGVATNVVEYCKKGDVVGIKGRIETRTYEDSDGNKNHKTEVIAEKVTFLSSKPMEKQEDKEQEIE